MSYNNLVQHIVHLARGNQNKRITVLLSNGYCNAGNIICSLHYTSFIVCMCVCSCVCMCVCVCTAMLLSHSNASYENSISLSGHGFLRSTLTDTVKQLVAQFGPPVFLWEHNPNSPTQREFERLCARTLGSCIHPEMGGLWSSSSGSACGVFLSVHAWETVARCSLYSSVFGNPPATPLK